MIPLEHDPLDDRSGAPIRNLASHKQSLTNPAKSLTNPPKSSVLVEAADVLCVRVDIIRLFVVGARRSGNLLHQKNAAGFPLASTKRARANFLH